MLRSWFLAADEEKPILDAIREAQKKRAIPEPWLEGTTAVHTGSGRLIKVIGIDRDPATGTAMFRIRYTDGSEKTVFAEDLSRICKEDALDTLIRRVARENGAEVTAAVRREILFKCRMISEEDRIAYIKVCLRYVRENGLEALKMVPEEELLEKMFS